ncbi:MAG: hypothetical protein VB980_03810, partial [Opitutales bacterium]
MSAPSYVLSFLLIVTGIVGYLGQTPSASILITGEVAKATLTLQCEDAPPLETGYWVTGKTNQETAKELQKVIIDEGNTDEHKGWYAVVSGDEKNPKLQISHKNGVSFYSTEWTGIKKSSGEQATGVIAFGKSWTAMIPSIFGLVLILCVFVSQRKEALRKHLMHLAALIALIGTVGPAKMAWSSYSSLNETKTL